MGSSFDSLSFRISTIIFKELSRTGLSSSSFGGQFPDPACSPGSDHMDSMTFKEKAVVFCINSFSSVCILGVFSACGCEHRPIVFHWSPFPFSVTGHLLSATCPSLHFDHRWWFFLLLLYFSSPAPSPSPIFFPFLPFLSFPFLSSLLPFLPSIHPSLSVSIHSLNPLSPQNGVPGAIPKACL